MATTEYVVLLQKEDGIWEEVREEAATGATKASRQAAEKLDVSGDYVAVPVRSFQPVSIEFTSVRRALVSSGAAAEVKTGKGNATAGVATGGLVGSNAGSAA